jgi:tryptophanyl-tRNA synthetase
MKRSLSGIKPTGIPHLGNYLGMIKPAIALQKTHETFYFIANYHALTTVRNAHSYAKTRSALQRSFWLLV